MMIPRKIAFKKPKQQGIAFLTTLVVLSLVIFACMSMAAMVFQDVYTMRKINFSTQAEYLSEAGIEEVLYELHADFNYTPSGFPKELGNGEYDVTITTHLSDPSVKLVTSIGTVKEVSETIKIQVAFVGPEVFEFIALGAGLLKISGGSTIGTSANPTQVHSNTTILVGTGNNTGTVFGDASACSEVTVHHINGTVTGDVCCNAAYIELPPFDDNFFQYYCDLAVQDSKFYTGNQEFTSDPCAGTDNHIVYVQGSVCLEGTWEMIGGIVATGPIWINKKSHGKITQHQYGNLPAFMSKDSNVFIWAPTDIEGMVYAGNEFHVQSSQEASIPTNVTGCVYGRGGIKLFARTYMDYVRPNPPGLAPDKGKINVIYWGS